MSAQCGITAPAARLREVSSADPGTDVFAAVHATSATDVWAAGSGGTSSAHTSLTEHWNGTAWTVVSSPTPGSGTEHWNGSKWTVTPSPLRSWRAMVTAWIPLGPAG